MGRKLILIFICCEVLGFFLATLLHFGFSIFGYREIFNPSEGVTQGIITLLFAVTLGGLILRRRWSWILALISHCIAVVGALFGILATVKNGLPLNYNLFNSIRISLLVIVLIILLIPKVKKALG